MIGVAVAIAVLAVRNPSGAVADSTGNLDVCSTCAYRTIQDAIAAARPGSTIRVHGGVFRGPLVIARPVTLLGLDWPVVDGSGNGTVVHIVAPDTTFQGFVVQSSGDSYDQEDSGILVEAPRVRVIGNRLPDDLFGIYLRNSPDSLIEGNEVVGKKLPEALRGDGIKVWYSARAQIIGNYVSSSRDCLIWFSNGSIIRDNVVDSGRYGFHFMYGNGSLIEHNRLENNSVGIYLMYGQNMTVRNNLLRANRGPSGDGLGLKEVDGATIENNVIVDNRVGIYVDNSPLSPTSINRYHGNVVAYNDEGLALLPVDQNNVFSGNSLIDNVAQVAVLGGGTLGTNHWAENGIGNFWSDYTGYDANGDGLGDVPYRPEQFTERLMDAWPILQLFRFSVAASAVDFAARSFPIFQPGAILVDPEPLTAPRLPIGVPMPPPASPWPARLLAVAMLALAGLATGQSVRRGPYPTAIIRRPNPGSDRRNEAVIEVANLTKRFGDTVAVHDVSFTVHPGESLALWGPNGAGKTTILRCLLGGTRYEGQIRVAGLSPAHDGTEVRRLIGYVPQDALTFDLKVSELAGLVADLRAVPADEIDKCLDRFGIGVNAAQPVSTLSGGMKQKLALALALLGDSPILLLDEPTANLDAKSQVELLGLLRTLKREGRTLIFTSHRWSEVKALADHVVVLDRGAQVAVKKPFRIDPRYGAELILRVRIGPGDLDRAQQFLVEHGFEAHRNGTSVAVKVAPHRKADPLVLLSQSGYPVIDFELEDD